MKHFSFFTVLFTFLLLVSCSDKQEDSGNVSNFILGDYSAKIHNLMMQQAEIQDEIDRKADEMDYSEMVNSSELKKMNEEYQKLAEELDNVVEEAKQKLATREVKVKTAEGLPVKLATPFTVSDILVNHDANYEKVTVLISADGELTKGIGSSDENPFFLLGVGRTPVFTSQCFNHEGTVIKKSEYNVSKIDKVSRDDPYFTHMNGFHPGTKLTFRIHLDESLKNFVKRDSMLMTIFQIDSIFVDLDDYGIEVMGDEESALKSDQPFVLEKTKLGPLSVGMAVANVPKTVDGLYDSCKKESETVANEDGTEETYEHLQFSKGGTNVFEAYISEGKISNFSLQPGSETLVRTTKGYYVGMPARTLFKKGHGEWDTDYAGSIWVTIDGITYGMNSSDLNENVEIPQKERDIKRTAKITQINN